MTTLTRGQIRLLTTSYSNAKAVLDELKRDWKSETSHPPQMFEVSAAVGCLETLLLREQRAVAGKGGR